MYTDANRLVWLSYVLKISFLRAKNRLILQGSTKNIPLLELFALAYVIEIPHKLKLELAGAYCPVNLVGDSVYTDSMIALNWLSSKATNF